MPVYNKLVRDRIPTIIQSNGKTCNTRILDVEVYKEELVKKLKEESEEYYATEHPKDSLEELADMVEVIRALVEVHGASWEQFEELRKQKEEARGGFQDRVFLIDVDDNKEI
ncbi:nucleoside triphosphate pyrophosphohydrolase [Paenibacillus sp. N1-5-1-14]|uniref:nucleoside triphosphate pyrophosphohydrolase n=1 Tax=Paenibacillus radicibacter TaxID=2972488 RepID=UPI002158AEC6|nr:nucleoside triphosphate pyrophosphohydrolase [Paenibacillus radicibacter]MCR8644578.1 nucleoside triphosphate pyrophosphohydrolase [Paenibacillus radicibacter]